jgi:ketosteroid isomerase-like protein
MPVSDNFDPAEIESTLRELEQLLVDPNNAVRVLYTQDAILMNGGPPVRGHKELLAREGVVPLYDAVITPESIMGEGCLASVFGHFSCAILPDPAAEKVDVACHFMLVLRKEVDGVWRVARECLVEDARRD